MVVVGLEVLVLWGGGATPHDGSLGGTEGSERGKERWGQAKPTMAEEPPPPLSLQTCRRGATMAMTMTLGGRISATHLPLHLLVPPPPPRCIKISKTNGVLMAFICYDYHN